SSTKRFINAKRAVGVMRVNASRLRAVRKRANSVWFWEQAAERTAFSAPLGPPVFIGSLGAVVLLPPGLELDSCESAFMAASRAAQLAKKIRPPSFDFRKLTLVLRRAQYRRQILREARARQNFIASRRLRLGGQLPLHVREEAHHANVLVRLPQLFNRRDRLAPRVQIHDDEFHLARHQSHQRLGVRRHFHFHAELLGGLRQLHLEKQVVHQRHDSSHFAPPLFNYAATIASLLCAVLPKAACSPVRCKFATKR